jgi:hypothetical protein
LIFGSFHQGKEQSHPAAIEPGQATRVMANKAAGKTIKPIAFKRYNAFETIPNHFQIIIFGSKIVLGYI